MEQGGERVYQGRAWRVPGNQGPAHQTSAPGEIAVFEVVLAAVTETQAGLREPIGQGCGARRR